jgi:UDP-glucose:(heptosyl)LPS alpha-1,3-glucosyltransferase
VKIALVARAMGTHGGTERVLLGFAGWLAARGDEVTVYCERAEETPAGVRVVPLPVGGIGRVTRAVSLYRASAAIPIAAHDVVLGLGRTTGHHVYRAGGGSHRAWLAARGGWRPSDVVDRWLDRRALEARIVVANSEMARDDLIAFDGLPAAKLRLVWNGVDLERFRPRTHSPGAVVGFLGTGFHRKGLATAIRAVARIPGARLVVVGRDAHAGQYERLAERERVRLELVGPRRDPEALLPDFDVLVLPTRYDPFANATLEALACGVPVVTSARNGASAILPEPWMVVGDADDDRGFAAALERALHSDPGALRPACRRRAEEFPAERMFLSLRAVLEEVGS